MMLCSILYNVVIVLYFILFEGFSIRVLVKVLLKILVPWNNFFGGKIMMRVPAFFLLEFSAQMFSNVGPTIAMLLN